MTKVFIGGSRSITKLNAEVRRRIDRIVENYLSVLIGDSNGADKAVQQYLHSRTYRKVEVFCTGAECRNNVGNWPIRAISAETRRRDFRYHAFKDRAMADECSIGLMLWNGKSLGTLMNIHRLVQQRKKVVVYVAHSQEFMTLASDADFAAIAAMCSPEMRRRFDQTSATETSRVQPSPQASFL